MRTAHRYRAFAEHEAQGVSPRYETFASSVADDAAILAFLQALPEPKRQPNLLFGAVKYLAGGLPDYSAFRDFVISDADELHGLMLARSTQTNEPGRCAALLPLLGTLEQPIALVEVGAAAGLCLLIDRYGYDYGGQRVGGPDAGVVFPCEPHGSVPVPELMPQIAWRHGLDLNPMDVSDPDTARWLTALVWVDEPDREGRLNAALRVAAEDPPPVARGDLLEDLAALVAEAPTDTHLVVVHSAVLAYLSLAERTRFLGIVAGLGVTWISFEGLGVIPDVDARLPTSRRPRDGDFVLAQAGEPVAYAHPHGRWLRWLT
jgi:hypothetical protein